MSKLKIGNLTINSQIFLAPLSGITDLPFRLINRKFGCQFAFTEMIDAVTFKYRKGKSICRLETNAEDKPLGSQLLGQDPELILEGALFIQSQGIDLIDINAACPAKKVIKKKAGAYLMKEPAKLIKILKVLTKNLKLPVTLKIRTGWDKNSINALEIACSAEDCGIKALIIHGRNCLQGHNGPVDYSVIKSIKKRLAIPVIASGEIWCEKDALLMFDRTGCDGIMVARGALGNPWIFRKIETFLNEGIILTIPDFKMIKETLCEHLHLLIERYGSRLGIIKMRKFFRYYLKNIYGKKRIIPLLDNAQSEEEIIDIINTLRG